MCAQRWTYKIFFYNQSKDNIQIHKVKMNRHVLVFCHRAMKTQNKNENKLNLMFRTLIARVLPLSITLSHWKWTRKNELTLDTRNWRVPCGRAIHTASNVSMYWQTVESIFTFMKNTFFFFFFLRPTVVHRLLMLNDKLAESVKMLVFDHCNCYTLGVERLIIF